MATILVDSRTNRIVFYTDDDSFVPKQQEERTLVCHYSGQLPSELSLSNCWDWKFLNNQFVKPEVRSGTVDLHQQNIREMLRVLNEKCDQLVSHTLPSSRSSEYTRRAKKNQAVDFLNKGILGWFIKHEAQVQNCTYEQAAQKIIDHSEKNFITQRTIEGFRFKFAHAIKQSTPEVLEQLRSTISLVHSVGDCKRLIA